MFCRKCGATIPDDSCFCLYCGEKIIFPSRKSHADIICQGKQPDVLIFEDLPNELLKKGLPEDLDAALAALDGGNDLSFVDMTVSYINDSFDLLLSSSQIKASLAGNAFNLYAAYCIKLLVKNDYITLTVSDQILEKIFGSDPDLSNHIVLLSAHPNLFQELFDALSACTNGYYDDINHGYIHDVLDDIESFEYFLHPEECAYHDFLDTFLEMHEGYYDMDTLMERQEEAQRMSQDIDSDDSCDDGPECEVIFDHFYFDDARFNIDDMESDYYEDDTPDDIYEPYN